jgi:transposase InsO family protein
VLTEYDIKCSMSRKANCWDNAPAESQGQRPLSR